MHHLTAVKLDSQIEIVYLIHLCQSAFRGPEGCPEEFAMNSHEQCVPKHAGGCPEGYHSHENDESGRCIPDNIPCNEGYIINPDYPECQLMEQVCNEHPNLTDCTSEANALQNSSNAMLDS